MSDDGVPRRLFAYGTLQLPDILFALLGRRWQGAPALLASYACRRVRGKPYPAIVPDPAGSVPGLLYSNVDEQDLLLLDAYEGELYERRSLCVECGGGKLSAFSYVLAERHRALLSDEAWDLQRFEHEQLASYLESISATRRAP